MLAAREEELHHDCEHRHGGPRRPSRPIRAGRPRRAKPVAAPPAAPSRPRQPVQARNAALEDELARLGAAPEICPDYPPDAAQRWDQMLRARQAAAADIRQMQDRSRARLALSLSAFALGLSGVDAGDPRRGAAEASFARQVAMYLVHTGFGMSLARVADAFRRDRSTAGYACRLVEERRDDPQFDDWIAALRNEKRPEKHAEKPQSQKLQRQK